jgi:FkbH-like protein
VRFKKWAKLEARGNTLMMPLRVVLAAEWLLVWMARIAGGLGKAAHTITRDARWSAVAHSGLERLTRWLHSRGDSRTPPDAFLVEVYNPSAAPAGLQVRFTLARQARGPLGTNVGSLDFVHPLKLPSGYSTHVVDAGLFRHFVDSSRPFDIALVPDGEECGTLVFLAADFVVFAPTPRRATEVPVLKCAVFDLDNTLWSGTLIENDQLRLKPGVQELLKHLDERGILLSVASKNDHESAMARLTAFGIADYFLCPQISWRPKSESIRAIADTLNIGLETFAFVDDSPFELAEVAQALPQVVQIDATNLTSLGTDPRLQGSPGPDSRSRRRYYQEAFQRDAALADFGTNYEQFLAACDIRLNVDPYVDDDLARVSELVQRTNQLNFSGRKYSRNDLASLLNDSRYEKLLLRCADRFGSYGTVGFCLLEQRRGEIHVVDLMLSCRIQGKAIEPAFLGHLIARHGGTSLERLRVTFTHTVRNSPAAQILNTLGFQKDAELDHSLVLRDFAGLATNVVRVECSAHGARFTARSEEMDAAHTR